MRSICKEDQVCVLPLCFLIFNVAFRKLSQQWLECAEFFLFVIFDFFKISPHFSFICCCCFCDDGEVTHTRRQCSQTWYMPAGIRIDWFLMHTCMGDAHLLGFTVFNWVHTLGFSAHTSLGGCACQKWCLSVAMLACSGCATEITHFTGVRTR